MYRIYYNIVVFRSTPQHYVVLSFIGGSQTINCSFTSDTVQSTEIRSDEGILDSVLIGVASVTIVALSKLQTK